MDLHNLIPRRIVTFHFDNATSVLSYVGFKVVLYAVDDVCVCYPILLGWRVSGRFSNHVNRVSYALKAKRHIFIGYLKDSGKRAFFVLIVNLDL